MCDLLRHQLVADRIPSPDAWTQVSPHELRRLKSALRAALATTFVGCAWETAASTSSVIGDGAFHIPATVADNVMVPPVL